MNTRANPQPASPNSRAGSEHETLAADPAPHTRAPTPASRKRKGRRALFMFILYEGGTEVKGSLVRAPLVLAVAVVAILVLEHPLERDGRQANSQADGRRGVALVAHDEGILHPIYAESSGVLLNPKTIQPAAAGVVVCSHIRLSTKSQNTLMLGESRLLVGVERVTGVVELHMFFLFTILPAYRVLQMFTF